MYHLNSTAYLPSCALHLPSNDLYHGSNARDRYLAAIAEAKAAEAEYLATEATRREEEAFRLRLEQVQQRKLCDETAFRVCAGLYDRPYYSTSFGYHPGDIDEYDPLVSGFNHKGVLPLQTNYHLREHDQTSLLYLQNDRDTPVFRRLEEERARITFFRRQQEQKERETAKMLLELQKEKEKQSRIRQLQLEQERIQKLRQPLQSLKQWSIPSITKVSSQAEDAISLLESLGIVVEAKPKVVPSKTEKVEVRFNPVVQVRSDTASGAGSTPKKPSSSHPVRVLSSALNKPSCRDAPDHLDKLGQFFGNCTSPFERSTTAEPVKDEGEPSPEIALLHFLELLLGSKPQDNVTQPSKQAAPCSVPSSSSPASQSQPRPKAAESYIGDTLKQQLETRLNNEYASEIRDTIQAILVSLADSSASAPSSSQGNTGAKSDAIAGKAKAKESPSPYTSTVEPTSKNVVDSMDQVQNIEAAFRALETDFTFPAQLDFVSVTSSSFDSNSSTSATSHLAFTSRNHPVRFYEQALSALLGQLDAIDSFGNDVLRGQRKEVVGLVERALEDLEREVEGRWKVKASKDKKEMDRQVEKQNGSNTGTEVQREVVTSAQGDSGEGIMVIAEDLTPPVEENAFEQKASFAALNSIESTLALLEADGNALLSTDVTTEGSPQSEGESTTSFPLAPVSITPEFCSASSLAESEATVRPYELTDPAPSSLHAVSENPTEPSDAFLLAMEDAEDLSARRKVAKEKAVEREVDVEAGSDWSEIDA